MAKGYPTKNLGMPRGNTQNFSLTVKPIDLQAGDVVYLTVKSVYDNDRSDSSAVIRKDVTEFVSSEGAIDFILEPVDSIGVEPGKYVYDITANFVNRGRRTLLGGKFTIYPVSTLRGV